MPIQRKPAEFWYRPGPVKVYLDDLEEIDRVLRQLDNERMWLKARFDEHHYELSRPEEFAELPGDGDALQEVSWFGRRGTSHFNVLLSGRHVYVTGQGEGLRGPLEEVGDVLRRRTRWPARALARPLPPGVLNGTLAAGSVFAFQRSGPILGVGALTLLVLVSVYTFAWLPKHQAVVLRVCQRERPAFWERRRDELLLIVVTAVLSLVTGYVLGKL
jgi:hypothetical protein